MRKRCSIPSTSSCIRFQRRSQYRTRGPGRETRGGECGEPRDPVPTARCRYRLDELRAASLWPTFAQRRPPPQRGAAPGTSSWPGSPRRGARYLQLARQSAAGPGTSSWLSSPRRGPRLPLTADDSPTPLSSAVMADHGTACRVHGGSPPARQTSAASPGDVTHTHCRDVTLGASRPVTLICRAAGATGPGSGVGRRRIRHSGRVSRRRYRSLSQSQPQSQSQSQSHH